MSANARSPSSLQTAEVVRSISLCKQDRIPLFHKFHQHFFFFYCLLFFSKVSLCEPNPCKNGGECIKDGNDFDCLCPVGFRGRFCHVGKYTLLFYFSQSNTCIIYSLTEVYFLGPDDCYVDDGESYRGNVSETENGDECLYWNSHFILEKGGDPFSDFEDSDGLGPHNFCRLGRK